jgi:predicted dehydrogenase
LGRATLATREADIVAFADPHGPSRLAAAELFPEARSLQAAHELIDVALDAILIATPNDQHVEPVLTALTHGMHVLCEKPLATSLEDCNRVFAAAATTPSVFQVGMELRHAPIFVELQRLVAHGAIGEPKVLWCHEFRPPFKPGVDAWRLSRQRSGGTLLEKNCHHFDLFNWLANARPTRVTAVGDSATIYADRDILDRAWVTVEYANRVQASLGVALFFDREEQLEIGVLGSRGKLVASLPRNSLVLDMPDGSRSFSFTEPSPKPEGFAHAGEVEQQLAFIHSIRTGAPPSPDVEAARWSHAVSLAAEAAVATGRGVRIGDRAQLVVD